MGDGPGGAGRVGARTGANLARTQPPARRATSDQLRRNAQGQVVGGSPALAQRQLALRHADWLNDARNPARQHALNPEGARAARDRVAGYRAAYTSGTRSNAAESVPFRVGERAAIADLRAAR